MNLDNIRKTFLTAEKKPKDEPTISRIEDLEAINSYRPTPKQFQAHESEASIILYGGSMGSGKSVWLVNHCIYHALKFPGSRIFIARYHLTSLKKTTMMTMMEWLPMNFVKKINKSENLIEFRNGSIIFFASLGDDHRAIQKLRSMELSLWAIDEASEVSEQFFHMLNSRLRLKIPEVKYQGIMVSNPSAGWLRERFIDNQFENHEFVAALPGDNPFLPPNYVENLKKILPSGLVEIWLSGNWNAISSEDKIFPIEAIQAAMRRKVSKSGPLTFAIDVSRYGGDESVIVKKQGNHISFIDIFSKESTMVTCGKIIRAAKKNKETPLKVDSIGIGAAVADRLKEQGYRVIEIIGSHSAKEGHVYRNKRAENYFNLKKLLPQLALPDNPKLKKEMLSVRYRMFSDGRVMVETKEEMRKRGLPSPNRLDSLVTLCAEEARLSMEEQEALLPFQRNPLQKAVSRLLHFRPSFRREKTIDEKAAYSAAQLKILQEQGIEVIGYTPPIRVERRRPTSPSEEMESAFLKDGRHSKII